MGRRATLQKNMAIALVLTLVIAGSCQGAFYLGDADQISMRDSVSLPLKFVNLNGKIYEEVSLVFGASKSDTSVGTTIKVTPDLANNEVIIGSYPDLSWGITCNDDNSCAQVQGSEHTCTRGSSSAKCTTVQTFLRFRNQSLPNGAGMLSEVQMMTTQDTWNPKGEGVLGLGPSSPVWNYLKNQYNTNKDTIDISLFYRANDLSKIIELEGDNFRNAVFVINGKGIAVDPFFVNYTKGPDDKSWILNTVNFTKKINDKIIETAEKACIANSINYTIATNDYANLSQAIFTQLCGSAGGCKRDNSNMGNIYKWSFMLYNSTDQDSKFNIELKAEELINFDSNDNAVLLIDDLKNYGTICQGATMAFGKYFLANREVVMRYNKKTGTFMIGFHSFEPSLLFLIILLVLASIIFMIFVIVCVYSIVDKARKHLKESDSYIEADRANTPSKTA